MGRCPAHLYDNTSVGTSVCIFPSPTRGLFQQYGNYCLCSSVVTRPHDKPPNCSQMMQLSTIEWNHVAVRSCRGWNDLHTLPSQSLRNHRHASCIVPRQKPETRISLLYCTCPFDPPLVMSEPERNESVARCAKTPEYTPGCMQAPQTRDLSI